MVHEKRVEVRLSCCWIGLFFVISDMVVFSGSDGDRDINFAGWNLALVLLDKKARLYAAENASRNASLSM